MVESKQKVEAASPKNVVTENRQAQQPEFLPHKLIKLKSHFSLVILPRSGLTRFNAYLFIAQQRIHEAVPPSKSLSQFSAKQFSEIFYFKLNSS